MNSGPRIPILFYARKGNLRCTKFTSGTLPATYLKFSPQINVTITTGNLLFFCTNVSLFYMCRVLILGAHKSVLFLINSPHLS
jgi:hypothetical protein